MEAASESVDAAATAYHEATKLLPQVQARLTAARSDLTEAKAASRTATRAATAAAQDLKQADAAVAKALGRVEDTRVQIEEYAVNAFMGRDLAGVDALLSLSSPADFVTGYGYLELVAEDQREALAAFQTARAEAAERQGSQADKARAADETRRAAAAALRKAASAESAAVDAERDVASLVAQRAAAVKVAEAHRAETMARYKELQAESARIAAEIRALAQGGGPVITSGANLPMPVNGWKTSDFGMRFDPIYRVWQLHAGVDLAAPGGAPIWVVAAGKVFRAGWNGGYGNYTCVYHGLYQGKGFATCYAHQSSILVTVNQQVAAGQVIGRVGTTGASTGNHLHFEIRLNGDPVDPWPWLT